MKGETSPPTLGKVIRALLAFGWIMPLALIIGACNIKRAEQVGQAYKNAIKNFAEL